MACRYDPLAVDFLRVQNLHAMCGNPSRFILHTLKVVTLELGNKPATESEAEPFELVELARVKAAIVIEKNRASIVIIELAIVERRERVPSAPPDQNKPMRSYPGGSASIRAAPYERRPEMRKRSSPRR